jgi:hypothetical protein
MFDAAIGGLLSVLNDLLGEHRPGIRRHRAEFALAGRKRYEVVTERASAVTN